MAWANQWAGGGQANGKGGGWAMQGWGGMQGMGAAAGQGSWGGMQAGGAGGMKRPASQPAGGSQKLIKIDKVKVDSKNPTEKMKLATIIGEYTPFGENHGQQVFKKTTPVPGRPGVFAFMYYWDQRDGVNMSGWWFGDKVGGNEVWAHCPGGANKPAPNTNPPTQGWKTPWDGAVNPNLEVIPSGTPAPTLAAQGGGGAKGQAGWGAQGAGAKGGWGAQQSFQQTGKGGKGVFGGKGMQSQPAGPNPQEAIDEKKLEAAITKAEVLVKGIESAVAAAEAVAKPLSAPDAALDTLDGCVKKTEEQVAKANESIAAAQKQLTEMKAEVQKYAPQAKKKGNTQFTELQNKIRGVTFKLNPLKNAGAMVEKRKAFQKTIEEIQEKSKTSDEELTKVEKEANAMGSDEETLKKVDEQLKSVEKVNLWPLNQQIQVGLRSAPVGAKESLTKLQEASTKFTERCKTIRAKIKEPLDKLAAEKAIATLQEKLEAVDTAFAEMEEAEAPFMTGIEDLPAEEHQTSIAACEKAGASFGKAVNDFKTLYQKELRMAEAYEATLKESVKTPFTEAKPKVDEKEKKLQTFRKNTMDRKNKGLVRPIVAAIVEVEDQAKKSEEASGPVKLEKLDGIDEDAVKKAHEEIMAIDQVGWKAASEAKKLLDTKGKGAGKGNPTLGQELKKLLDRLNEAQKKLADAKKLATGALKVIKGKVLAGEMDGKASDAEKKVEAAAALTPKEGEELGESSTKEVIDALAEADKAVGQVAGVIVANSYLAKPNAFPAAAIQTAFKEIFDKLNARTKAMREKLEATKKGTKSSRQKLLAAQACEKAAELVKAGEGALLACTTAEDPFLRGIEVVPLADGTKAIEECEAADKKTQETINQCKAFIQKAGVELSAFDKEIAKEAIEAVASVKKSVETMQNKMKVFQKETADRKKVCVIQKIDVAVKALEEEFSKAKALVEPLKGTMAEAKSDKICEDFEELKKKTIMQLNTSKNELNKEKSQAAGNTLRTDMCQGLLERLSEVDKGFKELQVSAKEPIEKFYARAALKQAGESITKAAAAVKAAQEASAPLIQKKGDSLYAGTILRIVVDCLRDHMTKSESNAEALWKKTSASKPKITKAGFEKFLKGLPGLSDWFKELAIPDSDLLSVTSLVGGKDGSVDQAAFMTMLYGKYIVQAPKVSLQKEFESKDATEIKELARDEVLEALEDAKNDATGISRIKVKAASGEVGFLTRGGGKGGGKGQGYSLRVYNAADASQKEIKDTFGAKKFEVENASKFIQRKIQEAKGKKEGPLFDSKEDLEKKLTEANEHMKAFQDLSKELHDAQSKLSARQETLLKNAREVKNTVQCMDMLGDSIKKGKAAEVSASEVEELAKSLAGVTSEDLQKAADPQGTLDAVEKKAASAKEAVEEARKALKEEDEKLEKDNPKINAAKTEKARIDKALTQALNKCAQSVMGCKRACQTLTRMKTIALEKAILAAARNKGDPGEKFYTSVGGGAEGIAEAKLTKFIGTLKDFELSANQRKLVYKDLLIEGSLSKSRFLAMVQSFYRCSKEIGMTANFEIGEDKSLLKMNTGEILEALEEPKKEESGALRVKGRALVNGTVGWVSIAGNSGTAFLVSCPKPMLEAKSDAILYAGEPSAGDEVRKLKALEVLEVLEGPLAEKGGDNIRIQGKAKSDGKTGWFTVTDLNGAVFAEKDAKYKCTNSVALTDGLDVLKSKVLRKIENDELLTKLEGPVDNNGAQRIKAKADKDDVEGWITIKGNAGTEYVKETDQKVFTVKKSQPLQAKLDSASPTLRQLEVGEIIDCSQAEKTEKIEGQTRMKVKALCDGKTGWVLQRKGGGLVNWSPYYRCVKETQIYKKNKVAEDEIVRKLDSNERVEFLSGPEFNDEIGVMAKFRADKDKSVGWIVIQDAKGAKFLTGSGK